MELSDCFPEGTAACNDLFHFFASSSRIDRCTDCLARHRSLGGLRPLAFAEAHAGAATVLVDELDAGRSKARYKDAGGGEWRWLQTLLSPRASWFAESDAFAGPVLVDKFNPAGFKRGSDFSYRFSSPAQLAGGRLQPKRAMTNRLLGSRGVGFLGRPNVFEFGRKLTATSM
jgi:hypothetical protein